jgi:DNA-binding NtrC family response regulator
MASHDDLVLLVDDDASSRRSTQDVLESEGLRVISVATGRAAIEQLDENVAAVVTDLVMPDTDGMAVLAAVQERVPHVPVLLLTGRGSERAAVAALKNGAFHYLTKPANPHELASLVRQAVDKSRMARELVSLRRTVRKQDALGEIVGGSPPMRRVFEQIQLVADAPTTVLIEGESGTGKELVARALHRLSSRHDKPFVAINCAALPSTLIESELFGHVKGAFTGATDRRVGKFEAADGGTLFIDEIGEIPLDFQAKLLRAIETRTVTPLGSNREISTDTRILAATHRNLESLVREEAFREDLYYRVHVVKISIPPLRERKEDIPLLTRLFLDEISSRTHRDCREISPDAMKRLMAYDWPGNVRQLRNVLEGLIVTATERTIHSRSIPGWMAPDGKASPSPSEGTLDLTELENKAIQLALEQAGGNRTRAAEVLGISVRTLQRKLKADRTD